GAGVTAAGANFVPWFVALALGAVSAGAGLLGTLWWDRHAALAELRKDWRRVTDPGPVSDPAAVGDSLLAARNPDREIVRFSPLRESAVRQLLHWCADPD